MKVFVIRKKEERVSSCFCYFFSGLVVVVFFPVCASLSLSLSDFDSLPLYLCLPQGMVEALTRTKNEK